MRVAILWTAISGYLNACLKELAGHEGVEIFVSHSVPDRSTPYDESQFSWIENRYTWQAKADDRVLGAALQKFEPEILVMAGWHIPAHRRIARAYAGRCRRLMVMDNPWNGSLRQRIGCLMAPFLIRPIADVAFLPGERQALFARKLGFKPHEILWGSFSCDSSLFARVYRSRVASGGTLPRAFLFVGRFVPVKGIPILVAAYERYRQRSAAPWPLICCGTGPEQPLLEGKPGIEVTGFVQPSEMVERFRSAGCLILPSESEHWSLVVHEATSAGLVVVASDQVGAAVHLVQPGYNGWVFEKNQPDRLAEIMLNISRMSDSRLNEMSEASHLLSQQFSPRRWATTLLAVNRASV